MEVVLCGKEFKCQTVFTDNLCHSEILLIRFFPTGDLQSNTLLIIYVHLRLSSQRPTKNKTVTEQFMLTEKLTVRPLNGQLHLLMTKP
jgi:hypothetical protein